MSAKSFAIIVRVAGFVTLISLIVSCGGMKKSQQQMLYLQGNLDTLPNLTVNLKEPVIQKGDRLAITVYSDNPPATAIFNQVQATTNGSGSLPGYLVDQRGDIRFQSLGVVHVEGLTKLELMKQMDEKLKEYLSSPYTDIRFLNFRVSVMGEVVRPGTMTIPEERISILELLSMAGDLTLYGRRDRVLVIREKNGKRQFGRVDLRSPTLFQSPFFNLEQNDVVVVEATAKKPTVDDQRLFGNLTLATTVAGMISTIAVLVSIFRR